MVNMHKAEGRHVPVVKTVDCRCSWHALAGERPTALICGLGLVEMHHETRVSIPPIPDPRVGRKRAGLTEWDRLVDQQVAEYSQRRARYQAELQEHADPAGDLIDDAIATVKTQRKHRRGSGPAVK